MLADLQEHYSSGQKYMSFIYLNYTIRQEGTKYFEMTSVYQLDKLVSYLCKGELFFEVKIIN